MRDDLTTGIIAGSTGSDHLIHHRAASAEGHDGTGMASYAGDDILEGSVPNGGQIHMFASAGNDWMILDTTKIADAVGTQGHHVYGGHGQDTFQFTNIAQNESPILGRLDDFDPTSDRILIEGTEIDLNDLPKTITLPGGQKVVVRVIETVHPEFAAENLGTQYFLAIGNDIFYALDGARDLHNGTSGLHGEERHFLLGDALDTLRSAETVDYVNPRNFVPRDLYDHREDELNLNGNPDGAEVTADTGARDATHMFGGKTNLHAQHSSGAQVMRGSEGDDVIDANTGNDTIFGGGGNDLIAGGIDNDYVHGGPGDDMIWGGDGADRLFGGKDDDYIQGGRGDDFLHGGLGNDTLVGGIGNDTLVGGGGEDSVNRFHFFQEDGEDVIVDFKVGQDLITLQDDIDPLSVELFENEAGNTVINYGQTGSVELRGVSLEDFQEAAGDRADGDDPIIAITTDPEEEILRQLRIDTGFFGDEEPPSLGVEGVLYDAAPFNDAGPGGYSYVPDTDGEDDEVEEPDESDDKDPVTIPIIPVVVDDEDIPPEEDDESTSPTCFVATAAYRDPWHPDVVFLRAFRDQWLLHRAWGRGLIGIYWRVGPKAADVVMRKNRLARVSKGIIHLVVLVLRTIWSSTEPSSPMKNCNHPIGTTCLSVGQ